MKPKFQPKAQKLQLVRAKSKPEATMERKFTDAKNMYMEVKFFVSIILCEAIRPRRLNCIH